MSQWNVGELAKLAFDESKDVILWHHGLQIIAVNEFACERLGYSRDELVSMTLNDIAPAKSVDEKLELIDQMMREGVVNFETELRPRDGSDFPVQIRATRHQVQGETLVCGIAREISEWRKHEQTLYATQKKLRATVTSSLAKEQKLRIALESGRMGTWEWDTISGECFFSDEVLKMTGLPEQEGALTYDQWVEICHPADLEPAQRATMECLESGRDFLVEYRAIHPGGAIRWIEVRGNVTRRDAGGKSLWMAGVAVDVTQRKQVEEELRLHRFMHEHCAEALYTVDLDGRFVEVNEVGHKRLGYTKEQLCSMHITDIDVECDFSTIRARLLEVGHSSFVSKHWCKDGRELDVEISARTFEYLGKTLICATARDVTQLYIAEQQRHELNHQLAHLNRIGMAGEMASAVAHELNQPLTALSNNAAIIELLFRTNTASEEELREAVNAISSQAIRAGDIVRRMRSFCMDKEVDFRSVALDELIRDTLQLLEPELRSGYVRAQVDMQPSCNVFADRLQLQQVLVNLMKNAIEAMQLQNPSERRLLVVSGHGPENTSFIKICDTGMGLDKKLNSEELFQAFRTTKKEGMGIGLAISKSIIERHGGDLRLESQDNGCTFRIDLPEVRRAKAS